MHINRARIISIFVIGAHLSMYSMIPVKITNKTAWNAGVSVEPSVMNSQNLIIPESKDVPLVIGSGSDHEFVIDSAQYNVSSDSYKNVDTSELIKDKEQKHTGDEIPPQYKMQSVKLLTRKIKGICNERNLDQKVWLEDVANDKQALIMRLIRLNNMPKPKPSVNLSILTLKLPCAESDALLCYYNDKNKIRWNVVDAASHMGDIAINNRPEVYISKTNGEGRFKLTIQPQAHEKLLVDIEEVKNKVSHQSKNSAPKPSSLAYLDNDTNHNTKNVKAKKINCEDIIAEIQTVDPVKLLERMFIERDTLQQKLNLINEIDDLEKQFNDPSLSMMKKRDIAIQVGNLNKQVRIPLQEKNELNAELKNINKKIDTFLETY